MMDNNEVAITPPPAHESKIDNQIILKIINKVINSPLEAWCYAF